MVKDKISHKKKKISAKDNLNINPKYVSEDKTLDELKYTWDTLMTGTTSNGTIYTNHPYNIPDMTFKGKDTYNPIDPIDAELYAKEVSRRRGIRKHDILGPEPEDKEELLSKKKLSEIVEKDSNDILISVNKIYEEFLSTNNSFFLYKILLKIGFIYGSYNWCSFDCRGIPKDEASAYIKNRLPGDTRTAITSLSKVYKIPVGNKEKDIITNIIEQLYWIDPRKIYHDFISNSDEYVITIEEFSKRGIEIDKDLLQPINFRDFFAMGRRICVFYASLYNELIVTEYTNLGSMIGNRNCLGRLREALKGIPIIENNRSFETININGIEYKKSAFESIVESDLNNFLLNLSIESSISEFTEPSKENTKLL